MRETEFYERLLGLKEPWRVKAVKMAVEGRRVDVEVECAERTIWASPESRQRLPVNRCRRPIASSLLRQLSKSPIELCAVHSYEAALPQKGLRGYEFRSGQLRAEAEGAVHEAADDFRAPKTDPRYLEIRHQPTTTRSGGFLQAVDQRHELPAWKAIQKKNVVR